jgi:hypothetical protein
MILTEENRRTWRKTCPSATLSTTNSTWIDPSANPGLSGERKATNPLSHSTASHCLVVHGFTLARKNQRIKYTIHLIKYILTVFPVVNAVT